MTHHVAFLRGINLGDRRVKMARLRRHLEELDLEGVATYGASGNAVFDPPVASDPADLERTIEEHLEDALGFPVDTFVRPLARLEALVGLDAVSAARDEGFTPHAIFLRDGAGRSVEEALAALETPDDRFRIVGREVLWLRRGGISDSGISHREMETALGGGGNTMRKLTTVERIVAKFGGGIG